MLVEIRMCFPVRALSRFERVVAPRSRLKIDEKTCFFETPPFDHIFGEKGAKRDAKRCLFGCFLVYFFGRGDFLKIDDGIERNAYFCLPRGPQNASKNR